MANDLEPALQQHQTSWSKTLSLCYMYSSINRLIMKTIYQQAPVKQQETKKGRISFPLLLPAAANHSPLLPAAASHSTLPAAASHSPLLPAAASQSPLLTAAASQYCVQCNSLLKKMKWRANLMKRWRKKPCNFQSTT